MIALQGGSVRPSAAGYLLFPLSLHSPSFSSFSPFPLQSIKVLSQLVSENWCLVTGDFTHTHATEKSKQEDFSFNEFVTLHFIFNTFHHWLCYIYVITPKHTGLFSSMSLSPETCRRGTHTEETDTQNIYTPTVRGPL